MQEVVVSGGQGAGGGVERGRGGGIGEDTPEEGGGVGQERGGRAEGAEEVGPEERGGEIDAEEVRDKV